MTSSEHQRASDRTAEAMLKVESELGCKVDIVVMVQGDEPMITPSMVEKALEPLVKDDGINVVNLMGQMESIEEFEDPNEPKVVVDRLGNALYFSREPIPSRKLGAEGFFIYKQVCIIPFRRDYLLRFNSLEPTELERIESIDMNRILEHGEKVRMVRVDERVYSVDTKKDLIKAEYHMGDDNLINAYL